MYPSCGQSITESTVLGDGNVGTECYTVDVNGAYFEGYKKGLVAHNATVKNSTFINNDYGIYGHHDCEGDCDNGVGNKIQPPAYIDVDKSVFDGNHVGLGVVARNASVKVKNSVFKNHLKSLSVGGVTEVTTGVLMKYGDLLIVSSEFDNNQNGVSASMLQNPPDGYNKFVMDRVLGILSSKFENHTSKDGFAVGCDGCEFYLLNNDFIKNVTAIQLTAKKAGYPLPFSEDLQGYGVIDEQKFDGNSVMALAIDNSVATVSSNSFKMNTTGVQVTNGAYVWLQNSKIENSKFGVTVGPSTTVNISSNDFSWNQRGVWVGKSLDSSVKNSPNAIVTGKGNKFLQPPDSQLSAGGSYYAIQVDTGSVDFGGAPGKKLTNTGMNHFKMGMGWDEGVGMGGCFILNTALDGPVYAKGNKWHNDKWGSGPKVGKAKVVNDLPTCAGVDIANAAGAETIWK